MTQLHNGELLNLGRSGDMRQGAFGGIVKNTGRITMNELAEFSPVRSQEDFMGKEHFSYVGYRLNIPNERTSSIFNTLVAPGIYIDGEMAEFYIAHGILIDNREQVGLVPMPRHLAYNLRTEASRAIAAGSVIYLARNPDVATQLVAAEDRGLETLQAIACVVESDLAAVRNE